MSIDTEFLRHRCKNGPKSRNHAPVQASRGAVRHKGESSMLRSSMIGATSGSDVNTTSRCELWSVAWTKMCASRPKAPFTPFCTVTARSVARAHCSAPAHQFGRFRTFACCRRNVRACAATRLSASRSTEPGIRQSGSSQFATSRGCDGHLLREVFAVIGARLLERRRLEFAALDFETSSATRAIAASSSPNSGCTSKACDAANSSASRPASSRS